MAKCIIISETGRLAGESVKMAKMAAGGSRQQNSAGGKWQPAAANQCQYQLIENNVASAMVMAK